MMLIDMTAQLQSALVALDVVLVFAATTIAVGVWHGQRASLLSRRTRTEPSMAIVGSSSNVPAYAGDMPSDPSLPEAA
jgi:hypothetical protein